MRFAKTFLSSLLGGACISFGGIAYLSVDSRVLGALFFTVGLFTICTFGIHLFTGKVCYIFQRDRTYCLQISVIWLGNLLGTGIVAAMVRLSRLASLAEKAEAVCRVKLEDSPLSIFLLSVLCNIFIYIAVWGFGSNPHELGKYLSLLFSVIVFILCGVEHCVANMFYFSATGMWGGRTVPYLLVMTLGNTIGGVIFPLARGWLRA